MKSTNAARIVQVGEPVLREQARPLSLQEIRGKEIQSLIEVMRHAMYSAPGVGLAAPQIGLGLQLAVIEDKAEYVKDAPPEFIRERDRIPVPFHVVINPRITLLGDSYTEFFEGCLSLAGFTGIVARCRSVKVNCLNQRGEEVNIDAYGWYARILQHEIDHLHGALYIDRMQTRSFMSVENFEKFYKGKSIADVKRQLGSDL